MAALAKSKLWLPLDWLSTFLFTRIVRYWSWRTGVPILFRTVGYTLPKLDPKDLN